MARKPRIHYPHAFYHVMLRGNGGMPIFNDDADRRQFLCFVQESIYRFQYRIHAFCLMTNHVHFLMQVGEIPLSKIIQNISFRFTRFINKKQQRIGHLFQGRYKALLVDTDDYLLQLVRYIHLNPMHANIITQLEDYSWSSHLAYLGQKHIDWLTKTHILEMLSENHKKSLLVYREFICKEDSVTLSNFDVSVQKSFPDICDDAFMKQLALLQTEKDRGKKIKISLGKLVQLICTYYGVQESVLHTKSQQRKLAKIRTLIACLSIDFKIAKIAEVATYFGRDITTISRAVSRAIISGSYVKEMENIKSYLKDAIAQA